ncbi:lysine transporter LysE [Streptosporangium carneum]|uniref:Lysine transporter LysE n=2 Tax=Streptosporangium carneum TaxID=47481 RepID=A0A9W6IBT7_9ACTN|nr:lysine transporter LysE [Streptosporangium carneum]
MIPGPDQALITRNALAFGRTAGLLTMFGGLLGLTVHATAAAVGLSALLLTSATAFTVLRVAGVVYLLWLGICALRSSRRRDDAPQAVAEQPRSPLQHVRTGFMSNVLNPKVALFFVTFLPQFLPTHGHTLSQAVLLSAIFAGLYLLWFSLYNVVVDRIGSLLRTPRARARIERITGLLLVGFAIRLAVQQP